MVDDLGVVLSNHLPYLDRVCVFSARWGTICYSKCAKKFSGAANGSIVSCSRDYPERDSKVASVDIVRYPPGELVEDVTLVHAIVELLSIFGVPGPDAFSSIKLIEQLYCLPRPSVTTSVRVCLMVKLLYTMGICTEGRSEGARAINDWLAQSNLQSLEDCKNCSFSPDELGVWIGESVNHYHCHSSLLVSNFLNKRMR